MEIDKNYKIPNQIHDENLYNSVEGGVWYWILGVDPEEGILSGWKITDVMYERPHKSRI